MTNPHRASSLRLALLALGTSVLLYARPALGRADRACLSLRQPGTKEALARLRPLFRGRASLPVELVGLSQVKEAPLWELVGAAPDQPLDLHEAAVLLARLGETGLFARIAPAVDDEVLELELEEHPAVRATSVRGLRELPADELVATLLRTPVEPPARFRGDEDDEDEPGARCRPPSPPRQWLAHLEDDKLVPGLLWQGLPAALGRLSRHLSREGYVVASFQGALHPDGSLILEVDEGRLGRLELRGVHPSLRADVEAELGLPRDQPFSLGALRAALHRVRQRWPFLHADGSLRGSGDEAEVAIEDLPAGGVRFATVAPATPKPPRADFDEQADDDDLGKGLRWVLRHTRRGRAWQVDGRTLRLRLRADRTQLDADSTELLRHTQVTGFAPGLPATLRLWDPGDRVHLVLDGLIGINSKRAGRAATGDLFDRMAAGERLDWLAGAKVEVPALRLAELGGQLHALTDTSDRWRIGRLDSYLGSMFFSRPESEYYRRAGASAFATLHLGDELTLGAEYRLDRYASLEPVRVPVLFHQDDQPYQNPAIDDGLMGSVVARLEWSSEPVDPRRTQNPWRATEASLFSRDLGAPGLRTLLTVEVGNPSLGGDFKFTKVVSDSSLIAGLGRRDTLRFRLRAAFGDSLPRQKQEALGGWEALRGYDFKEFRGDGSLLGTVEYQGRHFGLFADLGSVHMPVGPLSSRRFTDPSLGIGGLFRSDDVRFEAAWRTDQRAKVLPEARLLFQRSF